MFYMSFNVKQTWPTTLFQIVYQKHPTFRITDLLILVILNTQFESSQSATGKQKSSEVAGNILKLLEFLRNQSKPAQRIFV